MFIDNSCAYEETSVINLFKNSFVVTVGDFRRRARLSQTLKSSQEAIRKDDTFIETVNKVNNYISTHINPDMGIYPELSVDKATLCEIEKRISEISIPFNNRIIALTECSTTDRVGVAIDMAIECHLRELKRKMTEEVNNTLFSADDQAVASFSINLDRTVTRNFGKKEKTDLEQVLHLLSELVHVGELHIIEGSCDNMYGYKITSNDVHMGELTTQIELI